MNKAHRVFLYAFVVGAAGFALGFLAGCSSDDYGTSGYSGSSNVNVYGSMYYGSGFYDPWYRYPHYGRPYPPPPMRPPVVRPPRPTPR